MVVSCITTVFSVIPDFLNISTALRTRNIGLQDFATKLLFGQAVSKSTDLRSMECSSSETRVFDHPFSKKVRPCPGEPKTISVVL